MTRKGQVERPTKASEYVIVFGSRQAEKGWRDLGAVIRGPLADTWDFLTRTPRQQTPTNYPLKGSLGTITREGAEHQRWQHKPTIGGDARICFYAEDQTVVLEQVFTRHPNETK